MDPISIIMPVLGKCHYTKDFFKTFTESEIEYEFIIINNGKDEETKNFLEEMQKSNKRIVVIENEKNIGVASSWNQGIRAAKHNFLCIINNDIEILSGNWLREMQTTLKVNENVFYTTPATCYHKDPKKRTFKISHYEQLRYGTMGDDYIVGCCFMCPRKTFDTIGLFDEGFEVKYYEDLDFINRILECGKQVQMTRNSLIYHAVGATSRYVVGGDDNPNYYEKKWGNSPHNILKMQGPKIKGIKHFY